MLSIKSLLGVALTFLICTAGELRAGTITFPTGARRFIFLNNSFPDPLVTPEIATTGDLGSTPFSASPTGSLGGNIEASADAEHLKSYLDYFAGPNLRLFNGFVDTYTLAGPTVGELVPLTLSVHVEGTITKYPGVATGSMNFNIGDWQPRANPDVTPVSVSNRYTRLVASLGTIAPQTFLEVDQTAIVNLTATTGTPFDIAYGLLLFGFRVKFDFANTAEINFTVPDGYTLTSTMGWGEDDAVEPSPSPEPGSLVLAGMGAIGLWFYRRRGRRRKNFAGVK